MALDVIDRAVGDAVYLDEDAYAQMVPLAQHARTIEARPLPKQCLDWEGQGFKRFR